MRIISTTPNAKHASQPRSILVKKVLRGTLAAGVAFAACVGFGATATAAESDRAEVPEVEIPQTDGLPDINILNNACVLPWFWQGPFNVLVENQDGSYSACNGMASDEDADAVNLGENACVLPWFWQGPFNVFLGNQDGSYSACNGSEEISAEEADRILDGLPVIPEILPRNL